MAAASTLAGVMTMFDSPVETPTPEPTLEPTPTVEPVTPEPTLEPTLEPTPVGQDGRVPNPPLTAGRSLTATQAIVDARGGRLRSADQRIQLEVPPRLFARATRLSITPRAADAAARPGRPLLRFDLNAREVDSDRMLEAFAQPITLTIDLRGQFDPAQLQPDERIALYTATDAAPDEWMEVRVRQVQAQVWEASLDHFSGYALAATASPSGGWKLMYNPPTADLFSGAATFNYPIEVPPGRNGLQPQVNLVYSSRGLDGLLDIGAIDSGPLGMGWSLNFMDIVREDLSVLSDGAISYGNRYSLLIDGTGYPLVPDSPTQTYGRYRATGAPGILIERRNDQGSASGYGGSPVNSSHEYWLVRQPDGTTARLGYTLNSENFTTRAVLCNAYCGAGTGTTYSQAASRWRVDTITDTMGNSMAFTYIEQAISQGAFTIQQSRPSLIEYNAVSGGWASRVEFTHDSDPNGQAINRIYVSQAGTRLREYRLSQSWIWELDSCGQSLGTYVLNSIQVFNGSGSSALPATTFGHTPLAHWKNNCGRMAYVSRVDNGYGGATEISYVHDNRYLGCYPAWKCDAPFGYSYRVSELRTYDSVNAAPAKVQYAYGTPCYDQYDTAVALCRGVGNIPYWGPLVGHNVVTQTVLAYDGSVISKDVHTYNIADNNSPLRGRELRAQTLDANNILLTQTDNTYTPQPNGATTFTYLSKADETTYASGTSLTTRTTYGYDGYGNVTWTREYAKASDTVPYRTTTTAYVTSTAWIVNTPLLVQIYAGEPATTTEVSRVGYYYDRDAQGNVRSWGALPLRGQLVRQDQVDWVSGKHILTDYWYDAYGNRTASTDPNGNMTRTVYDGVYSLYPLVITNALTQTTRYQYYGLNGVAADGNPVGLLKKTIDPNNAETTYAYDTFGRLTKVARPYDSISVPTVEYQYYDAYSANGLTGLRVLEIHREVSGNGSANRPLINFYDGLGRLMQARAETVDGAQQVVTNYVYDARGNVQTEYVPTFEAFTWDFSRPTGWNTRPGTTNQYDALGRPVRVVAPDGTDNTSIYGADYTAQVDGNGHYRVSTTDAFGRLKRVDETLTTLEEAFGALNTANWVFSCQGATAGCQSIDNGMLRNIGTGSNYNANFYRNAYNLSGGLQGQGIKVEFKVDGPDTYAHFALESSATPYRRFGIIAGGNKIYAQYNADGVNWVYPADLIAPIEPNVWYVLTMKVEALGAARVEVWRKDNPSKRGAYSLSMPTGLTYRFHQWTKSGNAWLDNYHEFTYQSTSYTYNVLDNLTRVTDALGNTTVITYNTLSQKTAMTDPDMGNWRYQYDPAGNLIVQIDAKRQATNSYYDALNRLIGKAYEPGPVNPDTYQRPVLDYDRFALKYYYDENGHGAGIGRRTSMIDAISSASWTYDPRGRLTQETKTIDGAPYPTAFTYDAMNRVTSITYPTGEVVQQTYNAASQLTQLRSTTYGLNYASGLQYNALGQINRIQYPNGQEARYTYFGIEYTTYGNRFYSRLRQICVIAQNDPNCPDNSTSNARLNVSYWYDWVGNVTAIRDRTNDNQVQWFTYDGLDRLTRGYTEAQGAGADQGRYDESYTYDPTGNIASKGNQIYGYNDTAHRHAVTHLGNTAATISINAKGSVALGVWPRMQLYVNRKLIKEWDVITTTYALYSTAVNLSSKDEVAVAFVNDGGATGEDRNLWVDYVQVGGAVYQAEGSSVVNDRGHPFDQVDVFPGQEGLYWNGGLRFTQGTAAAAFVYDANGNMTTRVEGGTTYAQNWDNENRLSTVVANGSQTTRYFYDGDGRRVKKIEPNGQTTVYVSSHYEKNVSTGVATTYYFVNSTRVAVRQGSTVTYLAADHLNSASLTLDTGGAKIGEMRYKPFGETRWEWGSIPTDRRFTDQRREASIGLYDFNARFYSPAVGRFLSADTLVPDGKNPQAFNRYSYVNNRPLNYIDPSGHAALCADCDGIGLGGIFQAYRYWNDRPDDLRMALKSFFEAHPDYDLNLAAEGKDGFRSGLREGDWTDAAFSQMWVGMERGGWNEASKYFAVVGVAGVMAEGNGLNAERLKGSQSASGSGAGVNISGDNVTIKGNIWGGDSSNVISNAIDDGVRGDVNIFARDNAVIKGNITAGPHGDVNIYAGTSVDVGGRIIEAGGRVNICALCISVGTNAVNPLERFFTKIRDSFK